MKFALILLMFPAMFMLVPAALADYSHTNPKIASEKVSEGKAKRTIPGEFDKRKALALIYPNYDELEAGDIRWKPDGPEQDKLKEMLSEEVETVDIHVTLAEPFQQGGIDRYILITETVPSELDYTCHACAPVIGGAIFSKVGNKWQLDVEHKYITKMGSYGRAPEGKLVKIGSDKHGVLFREFDMHGGVGEVEYAVLISEVERSLKEVISTSTNFLSQRNCVEVEVLETCYSYNSKLEFVPGSNPSYFDLRVATSGTKPAKDNRIVHFKEVRIYSYDKPTQQYREIEKVKKQDKPREKKKAK